MLQQVTTKYGVLEGVKANESCMLFKGVPYAAPPVGELRFHEPLPPIPWDGIRKCDTWGPACPQNTHFTDHDPYGIEFYSEDDYPPVMNEDCLYLNIWTPAKSPDEKLPVMMWMHGGGVQSGYSHEIEFDGEALAKRGVIVITINYRLNIFGYFALKELTEESEHHSSGNYGLQDQIQALRWIHENIAAFGGDPDNVMAFGQSGGGRSTQALACSPLTKGILHHVAIHSAGGILTGFGRMYREDLEKRGQKFMDMFHIPDVKALRAIPWEELNQKFDEYAKTVGMFEGFNICCDGWVLPEAPEDTILNGHHNDIDYIIGCTIEEISSMIGLGGRMNPMGASVRGMARVNFEQGRKPMYMYCFERKLPGVRENAFVNLAFHSSELWYVFGTMNRCWRPFEEKDYILSEQMMDYWTNFAKTGDPNRSGKEDASSDHLSGNTSTPERAYDLPVWEPCTAPDYLEMALSTEGCHMKNYDPDGEIRKIEEQLVEGTFKM